MPKKSQKLCECGCGKPTSLARKTNTRLGHKKGFPVRFLIGHAMKGKSRPASSTALGKLGKQARNWKGGRRPLGNYIVTHAPGHPRAHKNMVLEHILIAEQALGKFLPPGAEIHHVDGNGANNRNDNLVICQSRAYHQLLHLRLNALRATGDPNKRRCSYCRVYDDPKSLKITKYRVYHQVCANAQARKRYQKGR